MYYLLIKQFFRTKTVVLVTAILMLMGALSIGRGKLSLDKRQTTIIKTIEQQQEHIKNQTHLHKEDLGLLLYYLKFSFINKLSPLAGISIGQSDVNSQIQNVKILNLEGQKYDTDLVNPMQLHVGNLDVSFIIIFLFPLVIIALTFNVLSEEIEKGTWRVITNQSKNWYSYLLKKLSVRIGYLFVILALLFVVAKVILKVPITNNFLYMILISYLYLTFWFAFCFFVIGLKESSTTNAMILLTSWLVLVVFLPVLVNKYIVNKYPIGEAYTLTIKQRDEYHKKWDTDKKKTIQKFYNHYPQFEKYGFKEEGFSWLWYYAMQQMGDDESKKERDAMCLNIQKREALSAKIAQFFPTLHLQLSMNTLANTSLTDHINFLNATTNFHEQLRLQFYPKIFESNQANLVNWENYKPVFYRAFSKFSISKNTIQLTIVTLVLFLLGSFNLLKKSNLK